MKVDYEIKVAFYDTDVGHYSYSKIVNEQNRTYGSEHTFFYTIEDKIISFNVIDDTLLAGYWWVVRNDDENLYLSTTPDVELKSIIKLKKVY